MASTVIDDNRGRYKYCPSWLIVAVNVCRREINWSYVCALMICWSLGVALLPERIRREKKEEEDVQGDDVDHFFFILNYSWVLLAEWENWHLISPTFSAEMPHLIQSHRASTPPSVTMELIPPIPPRTHLNLLSGQQQQLLPSAVATPPHPTTSHTGRMFFRLDDLPAPDREWQLLENIGDGTYGEVFHVSFLTSSTGEMNGNSI